MGLVSGPKKTGQLVAAVAALVVLVFGVTFAMNYLGTTGKTDPPPDGAKDPVPSLTLTFPDKKYPADDQPPFEWERKKPGFHDFWFKNNNDQPVKVGLNNKNCTCSSVELVYAPAEAPIKPEWLNDKAKMQELEAKFKPETLEHGEIVSVPAGATGWVRLRWSGEKPIDRLVANLWMMDQVKGERIPLETLVKLWGAMDSPTREKDVGAIRAGGTPGQTEIVVFSCTRPKLTIRVGAAEEPNQPGKPNPFVVSEPVELPPDETRKLDEDFQKKGLPSHVKCAYRIGVTVRERGDDGKILLDLGPFRRHLQITSPEEGIDPMEVTIKGKVEGEVSLVGEDDDRVLFNNFPASRGKSRTVTLRADDGAIDLAVDKTPDFLKAFLDKPEDKSFGERTWRLRIDVPPNKITGQFPRADDPELRDSAVYLAVKTKGTSARRIRIPVAGMATSD